MAQPFDALHFREIFGRTLHGPSGVNLAYWVTPGGVNWMDSSPDMNRISDKEMMARAGAVLHNLRDIIDHGEIFYVSSEISHMLWDTARQISDDRLMHFEPGDFPTRMGYVYFDGDLPLDTILSRTGFQPLRALLWGQLQRSRDRDKPTWLVPGSDSGEHSDVVGKILYSIVDNPERWRSNQIARIMSEKISAGKWVTRHWVPLEYDMRLNGHVLGQMMEPSAAAYLNDEERVEDDRGSIQAVKDVIKMLYVWCSFMQTEIETTRYNSANHDKVVAREGRPPADIRVITLRRYAQVPSIIEPQSVEVNWQYRWKVREHYRWQRVGPGRSFRRRTLVREHWKGPEDKPQAHQDTIQALVR